MAAKTGLTGLSGYKILVYQYHQQVFLLNIDKRVIDISAVVHPNSSFTRVH